MDEDIDEQEALEGTIIDDWLAPEQVDKLPAAAPPFNAHKYVRMFALDVGAPGHDQYVYLVPNGLCVVGLAPSHAFIRQHLPTAAAAAPDQPPTAAAPAAAPPQTAKQSLFPSAAEAEAPSSGAGASITALPDQQGAAFSMQVQADAPTGAQPNGSTSEPTQPGIGGPQQANGTQQQDSVQCSLDAGVEGAVSAARAGQKRKAPCSDDTPDAPARTGGSAQGTESLHQPSTAAAPAATSSLQQFSTHAAAPAGSHGKAEGGSAATQPATAAGAGSHGKVDSGSAATQPAAAAATGGSGGHGKAEGGTAATQPSATGAVGGISISFDIGRRDASLKQSGKKRTQGALLDGNGVLCVLTDAAGNRLQVRPVASGKLMEVNPRLKVQPHLLLNRPCREGYLAILFPTDAQLATLRGTLCPCDKYLQLRGLSEQDLA